MEESYVEIPPSVKPESAVGEAGSFTVSFLIRIFLEITDHTVQLNKL